MAEPLYIDSDVVLFDGDEANFGEAGPPYAETIVHVDSEQLVQVVSSLAENEAAVLTEQATIVVSRHEFDQVIFTAQMITVVQEVRIYPRRRNFMGFGPG